MRKHQIGIYEKAIPEEFSIGEMLKICKSTGYDFFEISIDRSEKRITRLFDNDYIQSLKKYVDDIELPIGSMCLSALGTYTLGHPDREIEQRAIDIFFHAIKFAEKLGIRIIQIPACDVPKNEEHTSETDNKFIENLKLIVEYASGHSVLIGVENMEDKYMDTVEKNMRLIREIQSPYLRLYSDSGNITSAAKIYGTNEKEDMIQGKNQYCAFHLKETRINKYGGLFYGDGHVDFQNIMKIAWGDLKIRRFVMEYWYTGNPRWEEDLLKARQLCEKWIRDAECAE